MCHSSYDPSSCCHSTFTKMCSLPEHLSPFVLSKHPHSAQHELTQHWYITHLVVHTVVLKHTTSEQTPSLTSLETDTHAQCWARHCTPTHLYFVCFSTKEFLLSGINYLIHYFAQHSPRFLSSSCV